MLSSYCTPEHRCLLTSYSSLFLAPPIRLPVFLDYLARRYSTVFHLQKDLLESPSLLELFSNSGYHVRFKDSITWESKIMIWTYNFSTIQIYLKLVKYNKSIAKNVSFPFHSGSRFWLSLVTN